MQTARVTIAGLAGATVTYLRAYFKIAGNPSVVQSIVALGTSTPKSFIFLNTNGTIGWAWNALSPSVSGADSVSLSAWNLLEVKFVRGSASDGGVEVYLNGALQFTDLTTTTTSGFGTAQLRLGLGDVNSDGGGQTIYWDDMAFGTGAYIGAGQSVAVQGKAGTPTYDAWTKNGDTTAALCWSETPFSNGKNCSDQTTTHQQTMLVNDTTLNAAVGASDVINGAYVLAVVKCASGTPTVKLMRRVAGVDTTSGTRFMATTDGVIPRGLNGEAFDVFVDTRANLGGAEIGALANSATILETIEDMWLLVDYTPPPPPIDLGGAATLSITMSAGALSKLVAALRNTIAVITQIRASFLNILNVTAIRREFTFRNTVSVLAAIKSFQNRAIVIPADLVTLRDNDIQRPYGKAEKE